MSKIIFYKGLGTQITEFMESIKNDSEKANQFITFNMMKDQTKITLDSTPEEIVSSLVTITTLINVTVFVPWMSIIRGSLKKYIDANKVDLAYEIWEIEGTDSPITHLSGETDNTYRSFPEDHNITIDDIVPKVETVLYIMPAAVATEKIKSATQKSEFKIDAETLKERCEIDASARLGVSVPQLTVATWTEFFTMLEMAIDKQPVNKIYVEGNYKDEFNEEFCEPFEDDFLVKSILQMVDYSKIKVVYGKSLLTIITPPDEETPSTSTEDIPDVSNDVEVVKD